MIPVEPAMTEMTSAEAIYFAAAALPPAERAAYLARACAGRDDLRQMVEGMLAAKPEMGDFLEPSAAGPDGMTHTFGSGAAGSTADYPGKDEHVGVILAGKYKLVEAIGEGGMGSVYMALQTEPVKRTVAVKVIKAGMDSKAVLARFDAERQALAMMDHPNIARVLDAGTTESGRPFFVMELVKGVPITQYCDERKLTPRQRLELFVPVCHAIQHAHQKGVIHRDIKPNNVLIALYDDRPVPKVIDFGIAKAAGQTLTDMTLMTGFGAVVGTPEYMSPEQAGLNNIDVDTRSDVYSLGVLLYELLTGTTPVDRKSMDKAVFLEILRIVREVEAPRPSAKLSTSGALPSLSASRSTEPKKLTGLLRNELDWIVMKALEKDRTRRYETANGFAADVQRYLGGEAVQAHPPSTAYRMKKFIRRHNGQVIAAGLVLFALLAGMAGTTWGLFRAENALQRATAAEGDARDQAAQVAGERDRAVRAEGDAKQQRDDAVSARARADVEAANAKAVNDFLLDDLLKPASKGAFALGPNVPADPNVTVRALMNRAEERVTERFADRPLVEAAIRGVIAHSYLNLYLNLDHRNYEPAIRNFTRVAELKSAYYGPLHKETLDALFTLAFWYDVAGTQGKDATALQARGREIVIDLRDLLDRTPDPLPPACHELLLRLSQSIVFQQMSREAVPLLKRYLSHPSVNPGGEEDFRASVQLAKAYQASGQFGEANKVVDRIYNDLPRFINFADRNYSYAWECLAQLKPFGHPRHPAMIESILSRFRKEAERQDADKDSSKFTAWFELARAYVVEERYSDAILTYERVRDDLDRPRKAGDKSPRADWGTKQDLFHNLGMLYPRMDRTADAYEAFRRYLEAYRERGLNSRMGTQALFTAALGFRQNGRPLDAIPILQELVELQLKSEGPDSQSARSSQVMIGSIFLEVRRPSEALAVFDRLAQSKSAADDSSVFTSTLMTGRAMVYEDLNRYDLAADDWNRVVELTVAGDARFDARSRRALCRVRAGRVEEGLREAEELAAADTNLGLYYAACVHARAAERTEASGAETRERYARRSFDLLRRAVEKGFSNPFRMAADDDLSFFHDRPGFVALLKEVGTKNPNAYPPALAILSTSLLQKQKWASAEPLIRECLVLREKRTPDNWKTFNTQSLLGGALLGQKKYADAEPLLLKGYEGMIQRERTIPSEGATRIPEALDRLIELYTATKKPDEVKKWQAERAKYPAEVAPMPRLKK